VAWPWMEEMESRLKNRKEDAARFPDLRFLLGYRPFFICHLSFMSRSLAMDTIENHNIRGILIMLSRRQFMNQSAGIFALGSTASGLWRQAARAAEARRDAPILVVLELSGGNDGLNTVIPHADDVYHKSRPALRVEPGKVLKLDDHVGLRPSLKDLHRLWEAGNLAVVQGVGYPDPNRSHFRSMEIWQTGTVGPAPLAGWGGLAMHTPGGALPCRAGVDAAGRAGTEGGGPFPRRLRVAHPPLAGRRPDADPGRTQNSAPPGVSGELIPCVSRRA
jgi:hypothetical protein